MPRIVELVVAVGVLGIASRVGDAKGPAAKARTYTETQPKGTEKLHVITVTFAPLPEWKERFRKDNFDKSTTELPAFQNAAGDTVMLLIDIRVRGKSAAEHLDSGVREIFIDSADATKIERTDRKTGRWWVVDRHAKMRGIHAALFVPDGDDYLAVCDVRVETAKDLDALAPICDTLAVTASKDRPAPKDLP